MAIPLAVAVSNLTLKSNSILMVLLSVGTNTKRKHGNLCPVGNDINELFCTKDVLITQKGDLYFYTEDDAERTKRSRQYCNLYEAYEPQTDEFYTYNDYLFFLETL